MKAYFTKYIQRNAEEQGAAFLQWLMKLYDKVVLQLKVSQYIVEQSSEVGVIFEGHE